jgi:hypothetical protein
MDNMKKKKKRVMCVIMLPLGVVEWNCYRVRLIGCYFDVEIEKNL